MLTSKKKIGYIRGTLNKFRGYMLLETKKELPDIIRLFPDLEEREYFQHTETKEFWFHASNVCKVLGFTNTTTALALHCDDDEKLQKILNGKATWFVSESGIYGLAMGAKTEKAKEFKRWLKHDVLLRSLIQKNTKK